MPQTEFKLFAPYNKAAALIGSFSDWQDLPMEKHDDGYFRIQVDLEDGIYQYRFKVQSKSWFLKPDQWVEINDPYMTEMDMKTEKGIVHVKNGQIVRDTYVWKHDDKPLPANHELVMYELHIADFVGGAIDDCTKLKRLTEKLDYLVDLGVNAIELMPITEYAGNYRWGYLVRYYFALESSYGAPEDLKRFVDECHGRGIRVILDGIYNHTDDRSPLLYIDRDYWYYHDKHYPEDPANYWGPELNYEVYDEKLDIRPAWEFLKDIVQFWIQEYHIDGIRYDAVRQLGNYEFLGWLIQQADAVVDGKPFYHIAEHIPDTSEIVQPKGVFEGCWHESFRYFLKNVILGDEFDLNELKSAIDFKQQGYAKTTNVFNYLATHDREHMIVELGDKGIFGQPAFDRVKLGLILQITAPGIPLIWMGDEFGQATHKANATSDPNPLDWTLLDQDLNCDLFEFYKRTIAWRKEIPALLTDNIEFFHENVEDSVLAYIRWDDGGSRVVVVANLGDRHFPAYEVPNAPTGGVWGDQLNSSKFEVKAGKLTIDLLPFSARVLVG